MPRDKRGIPRDGENEYWGRPDMFKSPDEMMLLFEEYKQWCINNPLLEVESIKSGDMSGKTFNVPHDRPMTPYGFAAYCKCSVGCLKGYGTHERHTEFHELYAQIDTEMKAQNIEGAMCGFYDGRLTARINGISDVSEVNHKGLKTPPSELTIRVVE